MGILGTLGSLNVLLSADTVQFTSAMEKAAYTAENKARRMGFAVKSVALMAAAAATSIAVSIKKTIDHADEIGEMASSIGLTVEQLSSLEYAAKLSGVEIESLRTFFQKFNNTIFDGAKGVKESATLFKALGISIKDNNGKLKSNYDLFLEVADALSKVSDGATKSALAQDLFGKSGAAMIPFLNSGKDGIEKLAEEASRLGIVLNSDTAQAADRFNDNMTRMASATQGIVLAFTSGLLPTLTNLTENMNSSTSALESFRKEGKTSATIIVALVNGIMFFNDVLMTSADLIAAISVAFGGRLRDSMTVIRAYIDDQKERWNNFAISAEKNWNAVSETVENSSDKIQKNVSNTSAKIEEFYKKEEEETERLKTAAGNLGMTFQSAFEDSIIEGKKFSDVLSSLLEDIERIILRTAVTGPLAAALKTGVLSLFGISSAHGNIFSNGNLIPFGTGGLITRPSLFPMANGGVGLAGEAGTEAILPLFRTGSGDLGVKSGTAGGGVEINVYAPEGSSVSQSSQMIGGREKIDIMIDEAVAGAVKSPGSKTYRALKSSFGLKQSLTTR